MSVKQKNKLSSKERILATIERKPTDHIPLCFDGVCHGAVRFIYEAYKHPFKIASALLDLGVDTGITIDTPTYSPAFTVPSINSNEGLEINERQEKVAGKEYPVLFKEYITPKGNLRQVVNKTEDYDMDNILLFCDYNIPASRSVEYLIKKEEDLEKLEYILQATLNNKKKDKFYAEAKEIKKFCNENNIVMSGYLAGIGDPLFWLAGIENILIMTIENPGFLKRFIKVLSKWDINRMNMFIEAGVDFIIRRGWYESVDFWSPELYRKFLFEPFKKEIDLAHQAGVKMTYVMNSGGMPLMDIFRDLKFDIWSNIDPENADLGKIKKEVGTDMVLCGGINNFNTLGEGSEDDVKAAVINAVEKLSPGGGFILAPSTGTMFIKRENEKRNVLKMIETWKGECGV